MMRPKLKEDPREWRKFAWVWLGVVLIIVGVLRYRGVDLGRWFPGILILAGLLMGVSFLAPRCFRLPYRGVTTASFYAGQIVGRVILFFIFVLVLTPMGLLLRLCGKDLLGLKRQAKESYWEPAKGKSKLDRQF